MKPHYYITSVHTDDENEYEPTHCSIELAPRVLWKIIRYLMTAWIIQKVNREIQEVRFRFDEVNWLSIKDDAETDPPEGVISEGGLSVFDDMTLHLRGDQLEALGFGYFRLHCYRKYGASFYSEDIHLRHLAFPALRYWRLFGKECFAWA
ncbi:MAG: hypothetical protein HRF47_10225 [Chloroflexota bacterium]|jgi:hypothetical protein